MERLIPADTLAKMKKIIEIACKDPNAELEMKILSGDIQTKDVADRIVKAIDRLDAIPVNDEHRASFSYSDGLRVNVYGVDTILKLCTTNSFRNLPVTVERKRRYSDMVPTTSEGNIDVVDITDLKLRFTLRHEEFLRKDFSGAPMDPAANLRILHRKSWTTVDGIFRIDMSLVKTKQKQHKTLSAVLGQTPIYELEVELVDRTKSKDEISASLLRTIEPLVAAYQQSAFIITDTDLRRYRAETDAMKMRFVNPVTMTRAHILANRPHNIIKHYAVTNKADGERCFLVVTKDRRLLRWSKDGRIAWTGLTANTDDHLGDVMDGEYLSDLNLYCIFDAYKFRGKDITGLVLMTSQTNIIKEPLKSRLGCAHLFVQDLKKDFAVQLGAVSMRIETKLFYAANGKEMQTGIKALLDTKFEYPTDGLVFTPRNTAFAPLSDRKGDTWLRVYKWKPANQNSIDFLVILGGKTYNARLKQDVIEGNLFVGRTPGSDIIYPCETMTGEYKAPKIPPELRVAAEARDRAPSPFQPTVPKSPDAYKINIPINARGQAVDRDGNRVESNTIIECVRNLENGEWEVLRTRYDKTYKYRVLGKPEYGNDINTADDIWTNIHNPVTAEMLQSIVSNPLSDTTEDELYYRDNLESRDRVMKDVISFHNDVKEMLYTSVIKQGDTLLELAMGRANDLHKWRKTKPSKVVGIEYSRGNLEGARQGACVRYIKENAKESLPPSLFIEGDMIEPLLEQDKHYIRILSGAESAPTDYLQQFVGLTEFDVISCQNAIHYACESEEKFKSFVGNLVRHGKGVFFGTCMDGKSVYSMLLGKPNYTFHASLRGKKSVFGMIEKQYADGDGWKEEFGKAIQVKLESFEKPAKEYLVPFERITDILGENGYDLVNTSKYEEHYITQGKRLDGDLQIFSFAHRSFIFKRGPKKPEPPAPVEEEADEYDPNSGVSNAAPKSVTLKKSPTVEPENLPVFFFAGSPALNATKEFTNSYEAPMQIDGITFPTVEHYYQWSKAKMFGDIASQDKILKSKSAQTAKTIGRKIAPFDEEKWNDVKYEVMQTAVKAKLTQHPAILEKLRDTGDRLIAESDPRNQFWGIGTSSDTSFAKDPARWKGANNMGKILMDLRTQLKSENGSST
jgi:ribA/ribD-fused uncharacterized protein